MKKHLSLFVPLLALMLAFAPQTARAQIGEYFNIRMTNLSYNRIVIKVQGNPGVDLYYSTDKVNWTKMATTATKTTNLTSALTYYFKGNNDKDHPFYKDANNYVCIYGYATNATNTTYYGGNIMSLVNGDGFATNYETIPCDYFFKGLNNGASYRVDLSSLSLPATKLTTGCYMSMFESSGTNYTIIGYPQLPAQKLAPYCYARMFAKAAYCNVNNTSIILPAEELADHCYEEMFLFSTSPAASGYTRTVEIMATSLRDMDGNLYINPLQKMFQYTQNTQISSQSFYSKVGIYFSEWGHATAQTTTTTNPTYNWWGGYYGSATAKLLFYHDNDLPQWKNTSGSTTSKQASYFPSYCTLNPGTDVYGNTIQYVTFDCITNGGYWNEGLTYNTNQRRVVRANYTMKTLPPNPRKSGARFIGWYTTASGPGSLVTESELKSKTTETIVYARFASDSEYTLFISPNANATLTATDGVNNYSAGTLYVLTAAEAARTFTLSNSSVASGYTFYKYTQNGTEIAGSTATFGTDKDLTLGGIVVGTSGSADKSVNVYQAGTSAGTSNIYDLPSEAVDLGEAGIWAKYNVDATTANGFASSETATGSWFSWGTTGLGKAAGTPAADNGWYAGAESMSSGDNLPVTEETDAAYLYCGHSWRMATYDEWANLLANTNMTKVNTYDRKLTSKTNSNYIIIPHNGSWSVSNNGIGWGNSIQYWTSTFNAWSGNGGSTAWGFSSPGNQWSTPDAPTLNNNKTGSAGSGAIWTNCGIRPILDMDSRVLTINSNGHTYTYNCDLYQQVTVTANATEGYSFKEWQDANGNVVSTSNSLVVKMYDNLTYTAVYKEGAGVQHQVTFYDYDGVFVLEQKNVYEEAAITYTGETPIRAGYEFIGWDSDLGTMGNADVSFTAQYVQTFTLTLSGSNMSFTMTADGYDPQTTSGIYRSGTDVTVTATVTNDAYKFDKWSDNVATNPRVVTLTANTALSASYRIVSDNQSLDIYQGMTADTTKILYNLSAKKGLDNKTYIPVDMGYGVAWADRNVGATSTTDVGGYFYWGGTVAKSSFTPAQAINTEGYSEGDILTPELDAATQNMGNDWRMPTSHEWVDLKNYAVNEADGGTFTNNGDADKSIFLPVSGFYGCAPSEILDYYYYDINFSKLCADYRFYWSSVIGVENDNTYGWTMRNYTSGYEVSRAVKINNTNYGFFDCFGMPVRAIYQPTYTTYTLTINVGERKYQYICQAGQEITVTANAQSGYNFNSWTDNSSTNATRTFTMNDNITTTATFALPTQYYDVTIVSSNSTYGTVDVAAINDVEEGTGISVSGNTLTIGTTTVTATKTTDDAQYTYAFTGWTDDSGNNLPATLTGGLAVVAHFTRTTNTYDITWKSEDGTSMLETDNAQAFGASTAYNDAAPTKTVTGYTYTFDGWATEANGAKVYNNGETPTVSGAATYYAHFTGGVNTYTITYNGLNGATNSNPTTYNIESAAITLQDPGSRDGFTFNGWTDDDNSNAAVTSIPQGSTGNRHFTANWTEVPAGTPHIDLYDAAAPKKDNVETDNATLLSSYPIGGTKTVDVTLHRKFTAKLWNTICLPFDFDTYGSVLNGKVFEMDKCTTSQDGMSISFLPVTWKEEKEAEMLAGQPYLVWTDTPIDEINFTGVQFKTFTADTTLAEPNGDVEFRAVFEDSYLTRKSSIFIGNGNHLYYAKQTDPGSRIRGYRGYFEIIKFNELEYTTPRVRIVINGEEVMSSEDNDTADIETRKYIEDGVLIIERGGVRYDAQGKRLE